MYLKFFDKLSQNFIELLNNKDDYNVIIEVENMEKTFTAHSSVLKCRSSYSRREFCSSSRFKSISSLFSFGYIYGDLENFCNDIVTKYPSLIFDV
ncbi:hypothetical protein Glove_166g114 [Diversispora epigaea]|uniref:BTB domain-containing protein n=1 Tax=Diversispora epigaea TaxID=1348612 RepID=A0A397ITH7_9GLOM|nr:hypothetical protein Glove_166g114 [Diversispora epigaea]